MCRVYGHSMICDRIAVNLQINVHNMNNMHSIHNLPNMWRICKKYAYQFTNKEQNALKIANKYAEYENKCTMNMLMNMQTMQINTHLIQTWRESAKYTKHTKASKYIAKLFTNSRHKYENKHKHAADMQNMSQ